MRRWAPALVAAFVSLLLVAAPASAHDGDPIITVEATHPADTQVHYVVKMVWENDGDPINGKTVTATPTAPDGTAGAAVTLVDTGDGIYEGVVDMPTAGSWNVVIASADPVGAITHTEVRPEVATTTTSTAEVDEPTEEQAAADQDLPAGGGDGEDDGDSGDSAPVLILVAALVVALGGGLLAIRTIRKNTPTPPTTPATPTPAE